MQLRCAKIDMLVSL